LITAVDTNVLFDVLFPDAPHARRSATLLSGAALDGTLVICEPVYAELASAFPTLDSQEAFLSESGVHFRPSDSDVLFLAGARWRQYTARRAALACSVCGHESRVQCANCGQPIRTRQHVAADFMIGAHALTRADRLLTRDQGYYGTYFPELTLA
jgi:predicted nucleic acid-binding protein